MGGVCFPILPGFWPVLTGGVACWFAGWQLLILYRADAPFPIFMGRCCPLFGLSGNLFLVLLDCCGVLPFWK